ncbi:pyridoxamine 5'-phosphate oxidase family protein [Klebsiella sp. BIGb0407]|uniref:pyridoxamine 5'-phosphate oxidase family protein n=1 Tax=Klebsiella sp. BIGb0407 TaxID=2940603 RepID=UPI00216AA522|nr:pyridoxamine 5'-phosphate oxidase family protein [Klebsiella sp. BIGb0407]MCS3430191.1 putative pyridoxine 5'-phosphate oxidase superfamily flavin-nucleotide-binding protein [Klebsiella sp. BIGb0407]
MKMNADVKSCVDKSVLCWLATANKEGKPNVSPKEIFSLYDDEHIVIADIASPVSVRNIKNNPAVCFSLVDIFSQSGFKITGTARLYTPDDENYLRLKSSLSHRLTAEYVVRNIILLTVEKVSKILAPSYHLHPERTEEEHRERTYKTYRVRPGE